MSVLVPLVAMVVVGCRSSVPAPALPEAAQPGDEDHPGGAKYAGTASCSACHPDQAARWSNSHHAHAWTAPAAGDPTHPELAELDVVGWIGWDPLRQPLISVGDGRVQAWDRAWDPSAQEWFSVFADAREPGDRGHWTGPAMTWNSQCAPCHTTDLAVGYSPDPHRYDTRVGEQGVGCEACHGPAAGHVAGGAPPPTPGMDTCAPCHARRADRDPASSSTVFLERYVPQLVDHTDAFYADGQVRDEDFEFNAFLGSRMHRQGVVCVDCHDPHSGELKREGDALCLECHSTHDGWAAHDNHGGEVACVDCHMPLTTYMQRHPRRDHGFPIPDPALAVEVGSPDSCTRACHSERDPSWAASALLGWGVDPDKRLHRGRARAVAAARAGGAEGYRLALELSRSDPHPTWQAVGVGLLLPWRGVPEVDAAIRAAETSSDPLIRLAVDLDPVARRRYLEAHRDQPDAAVEYGDLLDREGDPRGIPELRRVWTLWPKESVAAHALAIALSRRGDLPAAIEVLDQAVAVRPDDPGLWDALGRSRAGVGDLAGGITALNTSVSLDDSRSRSWYNLGILLDSEGRSAEALTAWAHAGSADPTDPDPHWAMAGVHHREGRLAEARTANAAALALAPQHPGALALQRALEAP